MSDATRTRAVSLRESGKTYREIRSILGLQIPKSTLSYWCRNVTISRPLLNKMEEKMRAGGAKGLAIAHANHRTEREAYLHSLQQDNSHIQHTLQTNDSCAKSVLAALYLAEGGKRRRGSLMFGNSDPKIIALFLKLLRRTYQIDSSKFRCTVLCRADQDTKTLEQFWAKITGIPSTQFYASRIDARTVGKKTQKEGYHGVCRIDYFSASVYNDLVAAGDVLVAAE